MIKKLIIVILFVISVSLVSSASLGLAYFDQTSKTENETVTIGTWDFVTILSKFTDFEDASKGGYASGDITTNGEVWTLNDALVGTLSSDQKNDTKSARLRNGTIETTFTVKEIENLSFYAGSYGSDSVGTLFIELSLDQLTWYSYDSFDVTTGFVNYDIEFTDAGLTGLGLSSDDELYLRFRSDDSYRINIDDVSIDYTDIASPTTEYLFLEDFETGSKGSYAIATITINGLDWIFSDSLIGTLSSDQKTDSKSIRLRNGYVETQFKVENMIEISFNYGNFGQTSTAGNLTIDVSTDGTSWFAIDTLVTSASFDYHSIEINNTLLNPHGLDTSDALYVRLSSNDSNRVNVDDFTIICDDESSFDVN